MKWSAGALRRVVREAFIAAWRTAPIPLRVVGLIGPFVLFGAVRAFVGGWLAAGIVLVLAALVVVLLLAAYGLAVEAEAAASEPRPYLVFVGTETKPAITVSPVRAVSPGVAAGYASTATAYPSQPPVEHVRNDFARVLVANDPPVGARAVRADRVTGRVEFYDEHGTLCLEIQGRWSETRQRGERSSLSVSYESVQLDIDANGLPHPLDIAMKHRSEADVFAFNDDNTAALDLKPEAHRLRGERFRVVVTLRGANADPIKQTYVLTNEGVGGSITLAPEETPPATSGSASRGVTHHSPAAAVSSHSDRHRTLRADSEDRPDACRRAGLRDRRRHPPGRARACGGGRTLRGTRRAAVGRSDRTRLRGRAPLGLGHR